MRLGGWVHRRRDLGGILFIDLRDRAGLVQIAGGPGAPEEVLTLELSVSAKIYERVSSVLPGIIDVTCQPFVLHSVVKMRQQYEGHARQVLIAVMGAEPTRVRSSPPRSCASSTVISICAGPKCRAT